MVLFDFIIFVFMKFHEYVSVCLSLNLGSFQTLFQIFFLPTAFSLFSYIPVAHIIGFLNISQRSLRISLFLFNLFSFLQIV